MTCRFKTQFVLLASILLIGVMIARAEESPRPTSTRASYVPTSDELFKKLSPAVVKIIVKLHGVPVVVGTGFFISPEGALLTNHHVVKNVIHEKGYSIEFVTRDNKVIKDFQVGQCGGERQVDLCLVKLAVKPKSHFKLSNLKPGLNDTAYIIGHPRGMDFTIAHGLVKGYRKNAIGSEEMEVTTPMGPGSSGGPLFDDHGDIVGVASKYSADRLNENFGIPLNEVSTFIDFSMQFSTVTEAREILKDQRIESLREARQNELEPGITQAKAGKSFAENKNFKEQTFDFGTQVLTVALPRVFDSCKQMKKKGNNDVLHACFGFGDSAVFTVQRFNAKSKKSLLEQNGQRLLESKPLALVGQLKHDGAWPAIEKRLTADQRNSFRSHPQVAKCGKLTNEAIKNAVFSQAPSCQFKVINDTDPSAESHNLWVQQGTNIFGFSIWLNDANLAEYFAKVPTFAAISARSSQTTQNQVRVLASALHEKRLDSYEVKFPEDIEFMGAKIERDGSHFDLYARRKAAGDFEENPMYSITEEGETVLPPSFDSSARKFALNSARILGVTVKQKSLILGMLDVDSSPARIVSGVAKDKKGRDVVIFSCSVYGPNTNHVVTKIMRSTDPTAAYNSFKNLCSGFKRK